MSVDPGLLAESDFTQLRAAMVRWLGGDAVAALVLTRLSWRCRGPHAVEGWWSGTREVIAEETGLSVDQVRKAVGRLKAAGHIQAKKRHEAGSWDQTLSYRVEFTHLVAEPNGLGSGAASHLALEPDVHVAPEPDVPIETVKRPETLEKEAREAVIEAVGWTPRTDDEKARVQYAALEILRVVGDEYGPSGQRQVGKHIAARAQRYRQQWPNSELSPDSLLRHWSRFGPRAKPVVSASVGTNGHGPPREVLLGTNAQARAAAPMPHGRELLPDGNIRLEDGTVVAEVWPNGTMKLLDGTVVDQVTREPR